MSKTLIILNPAANSERAQRQQARVESFARDCVVCSTSCTGEAESMARRAAEEGFDKIVAAGGDGTVNEVVNGLAGTEATLGLLPIGTMNVFATELGLPVHDLERCWNIVQGEHTRAVDLPRANQKFFVQLAGVGLDAQVVKETSAQLKRNFGPLSYLISAAQIAARQPPRLFIKSEDTSIDEGSFVLVGNGRLYGGRFPFFKHAALDDGLLDVVVFKRLGLAVVDEQHRFGVRQRATFREKGTGADPHLLLTTATPIPQTLNQTIYGSKATRPCRSRSTANWWGIVR